MYNLFILYFSYLISRLLKRVFHWGGPVAASFEPTNRCNLRCPECPTGQRGLSRPTGNSSMRLFKSFIDQVAGSLSYLTMYFQGEPYLHEEFTEMVRYARSKGIYVSSSTNGHFLTPENAEKTVRCGLNRLIVSVDGTTQEAYEKYRVGGELERVIGGIREISAARTRLSRKNPRIIVQFLILRSNEHQLQEIKRLGKVWEADRVKIKTAQFYNYEHGNPLMPENEQYSRYRKKARNPGSSSGNYLFTFSNSLPNHCFRMWSSCVITWDGRVVPCCFDKDAKLVQGSLWDQPFSEIWKSTGYRKFRQKILNDRKSIEICRNCTEGMKIPKWT